MTPPDCPACGGSLCERGDHVECGNARCGLAGRTFERSRLANRTQLRRLQRDAVRAKHRRAMEALAGRATAS